MSRERQRSLLAALLLGFVLLLSACSVIAGNNSGNGGPDLGPDATPTPDQGVADGVAKAYLEAWEAQNYEAMYSFLSPSSQAEYTLQAFTDIYTSTAATMQLLEVDTTLLSVLPSPAGDTAQAAYRVVYQTTVLGEIEKELRMQLRFFEDQSRWGIVWTPALIFPELAGGNTLQLEIEPPSRANIYDRNGLWLVSANASAVKISIVPGEVGEGYEEDMLILLSQVLRTPAEEIRGQYAGQPDDWVVALGVADAEIVQQNWNALNSYSPPLRFEDRTSRRYFNVLAPHVLGYTGFIDQEQLDEYRTLGYQDDAIIGKLGLESWGEEYLAGRPGGTLSAYTPSGQYFGTVAEREAEPAQSLYTTLDRNLQIIVQDAIEEAYRVGEPTWVPTAGGAAVVVMDVKTGDVLAMHSYPHFDPNVFNPNNYHPLATESSRQELLTDPLRPLVNRATQGRYPPGSVFKIVSTAVALESGQFEADTTYTCTGVWDELGNFPRYDWLEGGHGVLTLQQGLTASCNPWFYHIGAVTGRQNFDLLPEYARDFGFGQELGIEIDENPGLVPDPDWLRQERGEEWTPESSVNFAIGQGDLLATPLQVATMLSAIANGGTIYRPQLVDRIGLIGEDPSIVYEPEALWQVDVSSEHLAIIQEAMRNVTIDQDIGTAENQLGSLQIAAAGKTGTAEAGSGGYPHAWFAGFVPYEEPEIAIVVMVENGGQGSSVAAPIFRRIAERYYNLRVLPYPSDWTDPDAFDFVDPESGGIGE